MIASTNASGAHLVRFPSAERVTGRATPPARVRNRVDRFDAGARGHAPAPSHAAHHQRSSRRNLSDASPFPGESGPFRHRQHATSDFFPEVGATPDGRRSLSGERVAAAHQPAGGRSPGDQLSFRGPPPRRKRRSLALPPADPPSLRSSLECQGPARSIGGEPVGAVTEQPEPDRSRGGAGISGYAISPPRKLRSPAGGRGVSRSRAGIPRLEPSRIPP